MLNYDPNKYLNALTKEERNRVIWRIDSLASNPYTSTQVPETEDAWITYASKIVEEYRNEIKKETEKKARKAAKEAAKSPEQKEYERCRRNYLARHREAERLREQLKEIAAKEIYWEKKMNEADKLR